MTHDYDPVARVERALEQLPDDPSEATAADVMTLRLLMADLDLQADKAVAEMEAMRVRSDVCIQHLEQAEAAIAALMAYLQPAFDANNSNAIHVNSTTTIKKVGPR